MRFQNPPPDYDLDYMRRLVGDLNKLADQAARRDVTFAKITITDLPTSATGLAAGQLWNDAGTVKVV